MTLFCAFESSTTCTGPYTCYTPQNITTQCHHSFKSLYSYIPGPSSILKNCDTDPPFEIEILQGCTDLEDVGSVTFEGLKFMEIESEEIVKEDVFRLPTDPVGKQMIAISLVGLMVVPLLVVLIGKGIFTSLFQRKKSGKK
jgi:hypothetical protein